MGKRVGVVAFFLEGLPEAGRVPSEYEGPRLRESLAKQGEVVESPLGERAEAAKPRYRVWRLKSHHFVVHDFRAREMRVAVSIPRNALRVAQVETPESLPPSGLEGAMRQQHEDGLAGGCFVPQGPPGSHKSGRNLLGCARREAARELNGGNGIRRGGHAIAMRSPEPTVNGSRAARGLPRAGFEHGASRSAREGCEKSEGCHRPSGCSSRLQTQTVQSAA